MTFTRGHAKTGGRRRGARNRRTLAAAAKPNAIDHLEMVMTSQEPTITPDLKLRAAIALAQYQQPKPVPSRAFAPVDYKAPTTPDEAREAILSLGERMAKGEIPIEAHDALISGLKAYLGDKAAEQQKQLDRLEDALRAGEP
jgi:hypothetical protein